MHKRFTGASSKSKHCSETRAETVAPTPPLEVDSSSKMSLWVRSRDSDRVPMSMGFKDVSSIRSTLEFEILINKKNKKKNERDKANEMNKDKEVGSVK